MTSEQHDQRFSDTARQVLLRVTLTRWLRLLGQTSVFIFVPVLLLGTVAKVMGVLPYPGLFAAGAIALWLGGAGLITWLRRPAIEQALALWDERAGRKDMFVSAWCFEREGQPDAGQRVHIARALSRLEAERPGLARDLPLPRPHLAWILPLVTLAVSLVPMSVLGDGPTAPAIAEDTREQIVQVSERNAEEARMLDNLSGLEKNEKQAMEKLKRELEKMPDAVKKMESQSPKDVLSQLEAAARQAEKLAEKIENENKNLASDGMVEALIAEPDTRNFGEELKAKELEKAADEAERINQRLSRSDVSRGELLRMQQSLKRVMDAASDKDRQSQLGQALSKANQALQQPKLQRHHGQQAGQQFQRIAQHLRRQHQRLQSQRNLQNLARSLRASGQRMFGRTQHALQRMQARQRAGLRSVSNISPTGNRLTPMPGNRLLRPANPGAGNPPSGMRVPLPGGRLPRPGAANPGSGNRTGMPVPGAGNRPGGMMPGAGNRPGGAPVPGGGNCPGAGQQPGGAASGVGGQQWGRGTAALGGAATMPNRPTDTRSVSGRQSTGGESMVRAIAPQDRAEEAEQEFRRVQMGVIEAEEEALDAEPLPMRRREHVLRYFEQLRKHFEEQN